MRQQPAVPNLENTVAQNLYKPRERTSPPDLHKITITLGQSTKYSNMDGTQVNSTLVAKYSKTRNEKEIPGQAITDVNVFFTKRNSYKIGK